MLSGLLFTIGAAGVFLRRNLITLLLSVEIMLNAVNLAFVAFGRQFGTVDGQIITFFVMTVAAAEAAVGLALVIALFRHRESLNPEAFTSLEVVILVLALIPLLPFAGFLVNATMGKRLSKACRAAWPCPVMVVSFLIAAMQVWALFGMPAGAAQINQTLFTWITSGDFSLDLAFRLDALSAVMILVITGIGSLIHIYSTGLHARGDRPRVRALLLVPEPVRLLHAAAGARLERPGDVRRLGGRGPLLVPADRLLLREEVGLRRGEEGVRRQPRRRLRVHPRLAAAWSSPFGSLDFATDRADGQGDAGRSDLRRRCR